MTRQERQEKFNILVIDRNKSIKYDKFISKEGCDKIQRIIIKYEINNNPTN